MTPTNMEIAERTKLPSIWESGRIIHEAKIIECWGKSRLAERLSKEPWDKPNIASPNEPWHDVALAQARAILAKIGAGK